MINAILNLGSLRPLSNYPALNIEGLLMHLSFIFLIQLY